MRLHARSSRRMVDRVTLNLASMIDVTFLILIYFMLTTAIIRPEDRLSPMLQTNEGAASASDYQPQYVDVLMVDGEPAYQLGDRIIRQRDALDATLRQLPTSEGIFIRVADHVPVGFAVAALQSARDAGFEQVTYVPQP